MTTHDEWAAIAAQGLRHFGSVTAAVSHDLRNRLAVINEKAGLLEDLATMTIDGRAVDPERFRDQARNIAQQVQLANQIIRNLNTFAHTVDVPLKSTDIGDLLRLLVELSARKAAAANATIDTSALPDRLALNTMPYFLGTVIGYFLDIGLTRRDDDIGTITLAAEPIDGGVGIYFGRIEALGDASLPLEVDAAIAALLELLGGRISIDRAGSKLVLEVSDLGHHEDGGQQ